MPLVGRTGCSGSDNDRRTAAVLFSFTSTCHRLGLDPWAYLQDVLSRLPSLAAAELAELPHRWQAVREARCAGSRRFGRSFPDSPAGTETVV